MMPKFHWYPTRSKTWSTLVSEVKTLIDVINCYTGISDLCVYIQNRVAILDVFVSVLCCWKGVLYICVQMSLVCTQLRNSAVFIIKSMRLKCYTIYREHPHQIESAVLPTCYFSIPSLFSQPLALFPLPLFPGLMFLSQGLTCLPLSLAPGSTALSLSPIHIIYQQRMQLDETQSPRAPSAQLKFARPAFLFSFFERCGSLIVHAYCNIQLTILIYRLQFCTFAVRITVIITITITP